MISDPQLAIVMLGLFIFMVMLGFPIAFTLIAMGLGFGYYAYYDELRMQTIFDNRIFDLFVQNTFSVMSNDVLVAVPLFLFMGYIVERANIVNRLFFSIQLAARNLPGSMAVAALATCAIFATATGIIGAVILIPPSIMLIVYSAIAELSPLRLYAAAMFPGLMLAGMYMIYVIGRAAFNPSLAPKPREEDVPPVYEIVVQLLTSFVPLALLILSVLGAILMGLATPAEAAGVGAFGGLFLATCYRTLTWERLKEAVFLTAKTSAMVCWLFVGSWTFASVFSYLGGHDLIREWVISLELSTVGFLILAQAIIFLLGWPLEWTEIIIIFVPIFLPMLETFNVDPLCPCWRPSTSTRCSSACWWRSICKPRS
jgi:TRAP-type mannitol/chloroaromatic compound transport system permease large subunit